MLSRVEHELGMMRSYLLERAAQNDWDTHGPDELAEAITACLRRSTEDARQGAPRRDRKLSRALLRRAIRFVNDNLDSKLKWDDIASDLGLHPFTFGRGFKHSTGATPHQYIIRCRRDKPAIGNLELTMERNKPFSLAAVLGRTLRGRVRAPMDVVLAVRKAFGVLRCGRKANSRGG